MKQMHGGCLKIMANHRGPLGDSKVKADVCIVGSGPAGLALARSLIEKNLSVLIVERGGIKPRMPARVVNFTDESYGGIFNATSSGWGGASAIWGGQLLPMMVDELQMLGSPWNKRIFLEELLQNYRAIERWLGVTFLPYDQSSGNGDPTMKGLRWSGFIPIGSKWMPFTRRNLGRAWLGILEKSGKVKILLHQQIIDWGFDSIGDLREIAFLRCLGPDDKVSVLSANFFVVAAGALDTPLILQDILGDVPARELRVGNFLHDHLSLRVAEIQDIDREAFESHFSPFFHGRTMRSIRLYMPTEDGDCCANSILAYCHFVVVAPDRSGFTLVRDILRAMQGRDFFTAFRLGLLVPRASGDILRMLWMRYVKKKLGLPRNSRVFVNVDFVQSPKEGNRISLNGSGTIDLNWKLDTQEAYVVAEKAAALLKNFWSQNNFDKLGRLAMVSLTQGSGSALQNIYDIYHPAGTCATDRVVDDDLRVFGFKNVYVLGSAVFPKLGRANPTLTIMALALRLSSCIFKQLSKRNGFDK